MAVLCARPLGPALTMVAGALVCALAGCVDAPAWLLERRVVAGEWHGRTCRVALDGRDVSARGGPYTPDSVDAFATAGSYAGPDDRPLERRMFMLTCAGLAVTFPDGPPVGLDAPPQDVTRRPRPGVYRVGPWPPEDPGGVAATLRSEAVGAGRWPLAVWSVVIEADSGWIALDSVGPKGAAGRFRFVGRRRAYGP